MVFPLPNSILSLRHSDSDAGRLAAAQAEAIVAQADLHRVAERGEADDLQLFTVEQAHLQEALHESVIASKGLDGGPLAALQLVQGGHGREILRASGGRTHQPATTGRTRICMRPSPRKLRRELPTWTRHGLPG